MIFYIDLKLLVIWSGTQSTESSTFRLQKTPEYQTKLLEFQICVKNYLKKILIWFFVPVKAEIQHFSNLTPGGPRGDLGSRYFDLKLLVMWCGTRSTLYRVEHFQTPQDPGIPDQTSRISHMCKKLSKKDFNMIFCSSESWDSALFKSDTRGTAGGLDEPLFWIESLKILEMLIFFRSKAR